MTGVEPIDDSHIGQRPSADDRVRANRFCSLMEDLAGRLFLRTGRAYFKDFEEDDKNFVADTLAGDAAAYRRVYGDALAGPGGCASDMVGLDAAAKNATVRVQSTVVTVEPTPGDPTSRGYVAISAATEADLEQAVVKWLGEGQSDGGLRRFAELLLGRGGTPLQYLRALGYPVRENQREADGDLVLWHEGSGMLPPNIEVNRCPDRERAVLALAVAAAIAFPREVPSRG